MKRVRIKTSVNRDKPIFTKKFYFILIGAGIILLMVGSVLQFGSNDEEAVVDVVDYNGYEFNNVNGKWLLDIGGSYAAFDYLPEDVKDLYLDNINFNNKVYIAVNPMEDEYSYFIQRIRAILQYKGYLSIESCIEEEGCGDIPVVDCGMDKDIILIRKGANKVNKEGNCLILEGDNEGLVKDVDLLYYKLLGVL